MMDLARLVNLFITTFKSEQDEALTIFLPICRHEYIYVVPFKFNNVMRRFLFLLVVAPIVNTLLFILIIKLVGLIF